MADILDMRADIRPFFALACCDDDEPVLNWLRRAIESAAKKFVGHVIAQETITGEFHRREDLGCGYDSSEVELVGDRVEYLQHVTSDGHILQLDNGFVRSMTEVREDGSARFGQGASDFGASSVLTSGTHYFLELDKTGMSPSGRLHRAVGAWPNQPGTIKVAYVAGFTATELNNEYHFVKLALLNDMLEQFQSIKSRRTAGGGPLKKEVWHGDYTREFAVSDKSGTSIGQLSATARDQLQPIKRMLL